MHLTLIVAALSMPLISAAQKFQEPSREELQMTSDPKAPGAPAVYLNREESTDNRSHYTTQYARIKVLTELGKEYATVEVPYIPGWTATPIIEGRTIHSDGTVIPLVGKPADLLVIQTRSNHVKAAVFNMPSVEVGSIIEYKWTMSQLGGKVSGVAGEAEEGYYQSALAGEIPQWDVQSPLFIHKEHFYYNPLSDLETNVIGNQSITHYNSEGELASYLLYAQRLPPGARVGVSPKGDYSLDVQDVPALRHEANAPPQDSLQYRVRFYYTPYTTADVFWDNEAKRWSKQLDQYAAQSSAIKSAASEFTAGADTPEAKARKLYDAVQVLDNTDFTRAISDAERQRLHMRALKNAQDVLAEKSGSSNDLAALYLALARAAGLQADGMKVADRRWRLFDPNYLALDQLDALLVVLHIDGKDIYLDPGEKLCPFGQLAWNHLLVGGLVQNGKSPAYTPPNMTKDGITAHTADLAVDAHGSVTGVVKVIMNGPEALHWRQLNLTAGADEVQKQFNEMLRRLLPQGVSGDASSFQGLETSAGFLSTSLKVSGQLGSSTGKRLLLPGFFFSTGAHAEFVSEESRTAAVDLHFAEQVIDDVVYHLPAGYTVESAPQPAQLPWPDHAALVVKTAPAAGSIDIKHIFARAFVLLDAKEYPALRDYYQKVAASDQQQLVLAQAAAGGN